MSLDDLESIIGIEGACKFLEVFAGVAMRFPSFKSIQAAFREAMIRYEFKKTLENDSDYGKVKLYLELAKKYNLNRTIVERIVWGVRPHKTYRWSFIVARDEKLLRLI